MKCCTSCLYINSELLTIIPQDSYIMIHNKWSFFVALYFVYHISNIIRVFMLWFHSYRTNGVASLPPERSHGCFSSTEKAFNGIWVKSIGTTNNRKIFETKTICNPILGRLMGSRSHKGWWVIAKYGSNLSKYSDGLWGFKYILKLRSPNLPILYLAT